jgi:hypothetical protein
MRRRRFLGLAAFAGTSVIGVGVAAPAAASAPPTAPTPPAAAPPTAPAPSTIDKDTGWPVFGGAQPPKGYERRYLPCDRGQYVDVPAGAITDSLEDVTVLHPPYTHADWHRIPGGKQ